MRIFVFCFGLLLSGLTSAAIKWEKVSEGLPNGVKDIIYRAEVPHGWLLVYAKKSYHFANETIDFGSISFYPDENHEWILD
jgi:hypothetical protein